MDWPALRLSVELGLLTVVVLAPLGVLLGRLLAFRRIPGVAILEACLALPLVLPPTVLGFYLMSALGQAASLGRVLHDWLGVTLVFNFPGLLLASVIANLPFAIQPTQRAFESIPLEVREAAACCGLPPWKALLRVELPLAWPGIVSGAVLTFAHTLGEFGVVLMVGGSIPGETRTISIAIYDRVQAFDEPAAAVMSATLLAISIATLALTYFFSTRIGRRHGA
jgi:molybdate transport system permease protein